MPLKAFQISKQIPSGCERKLKQTSLYTIVFGIGFLLGNLEKDFNILVPKCLTSNWSKPCVLDGGWCVCFVVNFDESTSPRFNQGHLWSLWVNLFEFEEIIGWVIQCSMWGIQGQSASIWSNLANKGNVITNSTKSKWSKISTQKQIKVLKVLSRLNQAYHMIGYSG